MADSKAREAAAASVEYTCPRCGTGREPRQEYCLECGLRLPRTTGVVAGLRRRWIKRFGWYPGDWIWTSLLGLIVAIAGAAVAIALTSNGPKGGTTINAAPPSTTAPATVPTTTDNLPTAPEPTTTRPAITTPPITTTPVTVRTTTTTPRTTVATTTTATPGSGVTVWPAGKRGWTVVLLSYPVSGGRASPDATAKRAARTGLPEVGVLDSGDWGSLHPGYYVVFSGMYPSAGTAQAAVAQARAKGFSGAYVREIAN